MDVISDLLTLPVEVLAGQLKACAATDLAALAAVAQLPPPSIATNGLPLHCFVARQAIGDDVAEAFGNVPAAQWLRLFHFFRCVRLADARTKGTSVLGHLCTARPEFVRCGTGRCELISEELKVDAALVTTLMIWRNRLGCSMDCCLTLPLPESWTIHANTQLRAVAPVTHTAQVFGVMPLQWGEDTWTHATRKGLGSSIHAGASMRYGMDEHRLATIAKALNQRGECAAVRTHVVKLHLLSVEQVEAVARSNYQPLLGDVLHSFAVANIEAPLWALVYTQDDPGFFCFG